MFDGISRFDDIDIDNEKYYGTDRLPSGNLRIPFGGKIVGLSSRIMCY